MNLANIANKIKFLNSREISVFLQIGKLDVPLIQLRPLNYNKGQVMLQLLF